MGYTAKQRAKKIYESISYDEVNGCDGHFLIDRIAAELTETRVKALMEAARIADKYTNPKAIALRIRALKKKE